MPKEIKIEKSWKEVLSDFWQTKTWEDLSEFVRGEYSTKDVFPKPKDIFRAFELTPISKIKVVILGQDPYHGGGQAEGLSFSVPKGIALPPSLQNIYKELNSDLGISKDFKDGSLVHWAEQGVLLLNAILTVAANSPASHRSAGWEDFTDEVIKKISEKTENTVFILWGNFARSKKNLIDESRHFVIESAHPSPFSARSGFFGSKPFSKTNLYLQKNGKTEIKW